MLRFRKLKFSQRTKLFLITLLILLAAFFAANLDYPKYWNKFSDWTNGNVAWLHVPKFDSKEYSLGLDLQGGIHLVYKADLNGIPDGDEQNAVSALRDAIERRVNFLGVSEPVVQIQENENDYRLIVELAGITNPGQAIEQIGRTPFLEFKEPRPKIEQIEILKRAFPELDELSFQQFCETASIINVLVATNNSGEDPCFASTGLTGRYLERSSVTTHPQTGQIEVTLQFNKEGSHL